MSFQLLGFDFIPQDNLYGCWLGGIRNWQTDKHRSLFCVYYCEQTLIVELFWLRVLTKGL